MAQPITGKGDPASKKRQDPSLLDVSADKGDANVTLTNLVDPTTVVFNTPLTAVRTVTLATANADGGMFRIVRTAAATGAFALNVGAGPLKALATAGTWCQVQFNDSTNVWMLVANGTL
jgi:hypothetical protein